MTEGTHLSRVELLNHLLNDPRSILQVDEAETVRLAQYGAAAGLFTTATQEAVDGLLSAVRSHAWDEIRTLCQSFLEALAVSGNQYAGDALTELVIEDEDPHALQFATEKKIIPAEPARQAVYHLLTGLPAVTSQDGTGWQELTKGYRDASAQVRKRLVRAAAGVGLSEWAMIVRGALDEDPSALVELAAALPRFSTEEVREFGMQQLLQTGREQPGLVRETVLTLYLESGYLPARQAALEYGFLPQEGPRRLLFYLLTGQWQALEKLDFTGGLAAQVYEGANQAMRRRMITTARQAGRVDWIQALTRGRRARWLSDLSDTDWFTIFETLTRAARWEDMWKLAQVAPPSWGAPMLTKLEKSGYQPSGEEQFNDYQVLLDLARDCIGTEMMLHSPVTIGGPLQETNCLAISPSGMQLAVGTNHSGIYVWQLPEARPGQPVSAPPGATWALAYSPDGEHLVSGHGDFQIRVWKTASWRLVKTLTGHLGMVRGLGITRDSRMLVSAGFDGTLRIWRFPTGPELKNLRGAPGEVFASVVDPEGTLAASGGSDGLVRIWSLESGVLLSSQAGHSATITSLAVSSDGAFLASGSRDGTVRLRVFSDGNPTALISGHETLVTGIAFHPGGHLGGSVDYRGQLLIWTFPDGHLLQSVDTGVGALAGLVFSPDGNMLYTASKSGNLHQWDLRPLLITRLPVERLRQEEIERIQSALNDPRLGLSERRWFQFAYAMVQWRRRHDIEIMEPERIQVGEYDIEIE